MPFSKLPINLSDKQKKGLLIGLLVVTLLIIALVVYRKKQKAKKAAALQSPFSPISVDTPVVEAKEIALPNDTFPLQLGSRGKRVEQLQLFLIKKHQAKFPAHGADGKWGKETEANVQKFLQVSQVDEKLFASLRATDYKTFKYA